MDITLALGGGGAKGHAHIGVIRQLEKEGFRIKGIAGSSFGGLVAVYYALGYSPDQIEEMFSLHDQALLALRPRPWGSAVTARACRRDELTGRFTRRSHFR